MPPRAPRRSASVPTSASLLNRIQKPPLADRLSRDDSTIKAPSGPYVHSFFPTFLSYRLPCLSLSDVLLQVDRSVTDLLVVVEVVPTLTPTSRVHPKVLKNPRLPQSSIKSWMRLWEMLMLFSRTILLLQLLEVLLIWLKRFFFSQYLWFFSVLF